MNKIRLFLRMLALLPGMAMASSQPVPAAWFEAFKQQASDEQLYQFLYLLPKGGDLHNHLSGSGLSEWWWQLASDQQRNGGYRYLTQVAAGACPDEQQDEYQPLSAFMAYSNIQYSSWQQLSRCEQQQYKALEQLNAAEKKGWLNSIRLDKGREGRDEFFETHWARLGDLLRNPYIQGEMLVLNMQAFGAEGLIYLETQAGVDGFIQADGSPIGQEEVYAMMVERLARPDALQTGVTTRLQYALLRFAPDAEQQLDSMYRFVDQHRQLYVGINMVGREDNDKGYPLRFLSTLRRLRSQLPPVNLSIHGGESDEPNFHVRDTLLLGANRIGHGINLIDDPQTMLLMRHNQYLVEINLISNLLLEYVADYREHPFPEYLRTGIPVALSTDDRGMWDSGMTDEYFVALKQFNLSWQELVSLGRNSLLYSFADEQSKGELLAKYAQNIAQFEQAFLQRGTALLSSTKPPVRGFMCRQYQLCASH